ncbi:MAG: phosphate signaling complex protein PhoU [Eubacteriales bacterium]|nr:phosphate signaling complex protein PhoU [Lachnospiraceae bacterium]MDO5126336.1 phosphate signaling complex protein PhoU [Eubacteriales bacterium]
MARINYDIQLKELKNHMLLLGSMIEEIIKETICALAKQDAEKARDITSRDEKVDAEVRLISQVCYTLLLTQQPVAKDLRAVSAALKMITDMERIGDHGTDISELTILMSCEPYPEEIKIVEQMSKETIDMLIMAVDAFAEDNAEKAKQVIAKDDAVDSLFLAVKSSIAKYIKTNNTNAMQELDLLMVAKYFERIGDHATNIAEWVLFSITGEFPKD